MRLVNELHFDRVVMPPMSDEIHDVYAEVYSDLSRWYSFWRQAEWEWGTEQRDLAYGVYKALRAPWLVSCGPVDVDPEPGQERLATEEDRASGIEAAAAAMRAERHAQALHRLRRRSDPWWGRVLNGAVYRLTMRVMHRYGWCYPQHTYVDLDAVWCHWCGMRGRR